MTGSKGGTTSWLLVQVANCVPAFEGAVLKHPGPARRGLHERDAGDVDVVAEERTSPSWNIGRFGGLTLLELLQVLRSMPAVSSPRVPNLYCDRRCVVKTGDAPGPACARRTSSVWRRTVSPGIDRPAVDDLERRVDDERREDRRPSGPTASLRRRASRSAWRRASASRARSGPARPAVGKPATGSKRPSVWSSRRS